MPGQRRRIPIGTQRAGVAPPSLAAKYRYVGPAAAAPADAALPPLPPPPGAPAAAALAPPAAPPAAPPTQPPS